MFVDARRDLSGMAVETDVCIVGAGPAGLGLALELAGRRRQVCVLESGGFDIDGPSQALARADCVGLPMLALDIARVRAFGGTSIRWGGICRPLDGDDFLRRDWIPHSGWPIDRRALEPFYARALRRLGIAHDDWTPRRWAEDCPLLAGLPAHGALVPADLRLAPQPRLGERWRRRVGAAGNVKVFLYANVCEIETNDTASRVGGLRVRCLDGGAFTVRATTYVLAAGGIENARLLLLSRRVQPHGLGNGHDLVGRFLMNHPQLAAAWVLPSARTPALPAVRPWSTRRLQRLAVSPQAMAREGMAKFSAYLLPVGGAFHHPLSGGDGFRSLAGLLGKDARAPLDAGRGAQLRGVVADLLGALRDVYRRLRVQALGGPVACVLAENEQVPDPASRVTLSPERDALGLPKAVVNWQLGALDRWTMRRGLALLAEELARAGRGTMLLHEWVRDESGAPFPGEDWAHHAGTTRMSEDPRTGVVDRDCRVHGVANLYVAGSSTFPTEGMAPPTLTIMALAIRLADHLITRAEKTPAVFDAPHRPPRRARRALAAG